MQKNAAYYIHTFTQSNCLKMQLLQVLVIVILQADAAGALLNDYPVVG